MVKINLKHIGSIHMSSQGYQYYFFGGAALPFELIIIQFLKIAFTGLITSIT